MRSLAAGCRRWCAREIRRTVYAVYIYCTAPCRSLARCQSPATSLITHDTAASGSANQRDRYISLALSILCCNISRCLSLTTGRSHLRSANACLLSVPHTRTTYGDRSFAVSGPVAWNSLPVALRSSDVTEETFRRHLKTFLYNCLDN